MSPEDAHLILAVIAEGRHDLAGAEREARLALGPEVARASRR